MGITVHYSERHSDTSILLTHRETGIVIFSEIHATRVENYEAALKEMNMVLDELKKLEQK